MYLETNEGLAPVPSLTQAPSKSLREANIMCLHGHVLCKICKVRYVLVLGKAVGPTKPERAPDRKERQNICE